MAWTPARAHGRGLAGRGLRGYDSADMKCPHCRVAFHEKWDRNYIGIDADGAWIVLDAHCPECKRVMLLVLNGPPVKDLNGHLIGVEPVQRRFLAYPKGTTRPACPAEVPAGLTEDYGEACLVLADSAKASAALSRRCLQNLLREAANVKPGDLYDEIQQVLDSKALPSSIADAIDAVRAIGNFAAHPVKSQHTGEVLPVEPGEAEWNLDVLESLFDFYFVQPARIRAKKDALNKKLAEAGKKPAR